MKRFRFLLAGAQGMRASNGCFPLRNPKTLHSHIPTGKLFGPLEKSSIRTCFGRLVWIDATGEVSATDLGHAIPWAEDLGLMADGAFQALGPKRTEARETVDLDRRGWSVLEDLG